MEKIALNSTENSDNTNSVYKVNFQPNLLCLVQLRKIGANRVFSSCQHKSQKLFFDNIAVFPPWVTLMY
jgi:hypothetical protein